MAIGLRLGMVGAIAGLGVAALCESALALENWQFDAGHEQLVISVPKGVTPQYYLMAEPARIVLDLPNTEVGTATEQSYGGAVRQIRIAQFQPGMTRIVLELSPNTVLAPGQVELKQIPGDGTAIQRWTLRPLLAGAAAAPDSKAPILPSPVPAIPLAQAPSPAADSLPPLEPGAVEIPVEAPAATVAQPVPADLIAAAPALPSAIPVTAASAPIQVDFSTPLPATSAELEIASSAVGLSSTSAQQAARLRANSPAALSAMASGARSFPLPTADGVSVPDLSTVIANAAEDANPDDANPDDANPDDANPDSAASSASPSSAELPKVTESAEAEVPTNPAPQPRLTARQRRAAQAAQSAETQPETQPEAQPVLSPAAPGAIQIIPFGQPLPR
jgi:hypothetical protein